MVISDDAAGDAEQPWFDPRRCPAKAVDAGHGAHHRLADDVVSSVAADVLTGICAQTRIDGAVDALPRGVVACCRVLDESLGLGRCQPVAG
jgi:hypothetical protein